MEEVFGLLMLSSRAGRHNAAWVLAELGVANVDGTHLALQREKVSQASAWKARYASYSCARNADIGMPTRPSFERLRPFNIDQVLMS